MLNLVIFGAPGSGKGTQSQRLIDRYGLFHISTGELLRDHIARGTELGKIADSYISKGNLIPDDLMLHVLEKTLDDNPELTRNGVIFDGFPRTIPQAQALDSMLQRRGTKLHSVVGLEVPEDELVERMLQRGKDSGRADDNADTIKTRLKVYHHSTAPLRKFYADRNAYHPVDGSGHPDKIFKDISRHIDSLNEVQTSAKG